MDLREVKDRVHQLEGAIKRLDSVRKHLGRNASDIKTEIHASVSRNLECLRGREVNLLNAVDQVLGVKEDALQGQQARLNQALGVLQTSLSMAGGADTDRQLVETLDRLNNIELSPEETPHISFRADHLSLREAILSYGRVDANGLPLATAFDDPSKPSASLPRHLEEYEDADHHVFYKTLGQAQTGPNPVTSINVTIPKLSTRMEDWLQRYEPTPSKPSALAVNLSPAKRPSSLPQQVRDGAVTGSSTPGSSCSLNNWLSLIKQHADLEEEHDFEIRDNTGKPEALTPLKAKSKKDFFPYAQKDLKFWLQPGAPGNSSFSDDFFKHISSDPKIWLKQACSQLRELTTSHCKERVKDPFAHISKDPSVWLHSHAPSKSGKFLTSSKISVQRDHDPVAPKAEGVNFFSHISTNKEDWLHQKSKTQRSEASPNAKNSMETRKWLMKEKTENQPPEPRMRPFELEDVCRANELCCSMNECVSKPDCITMYMCNEVTTSSPISCGSPKDKNGRGQALTHEAYSFQHWSSLKNEDWLLPASGTKSSVGSLKESMEEKLEKLSLDITIVDKAEKKDEVKEEKAGTDNCDFFHMIPSASDPIWLSSALDVPPAKKKGVKEEENLWLQASPVTADALFKEWLMLTKTKTSDETVKEKEDSEGWSVVSDSFSIPSEQQELDVATADNYINKWLL
ncbi:nuclear receptor coactivator 4 [Plakobranchus ocellatus]|uniref:Nuclear receptor coactivator 4 n=1 Tax=Plakobranchus ocellatus TaxID=259542 RepID=A0AAV4A5R4_9GAST|nr:nuclear receptor coactivator 4 [Plakobranchus ocellatus]